MADMAANVDVAIVDVYVVQKETSEEASTKKVNKLNNHRQWC